jgi:hypothetical protein
MQGKEIDLDQLRARNEMTLAVGNVKVNARGDELGPGGKIIRKREEIMAEYHAAHPEAVQSKKPAKKEEVQVPPNSGLDDEDNTPEEE